MITSRRGFDNPTVKSANRETCNGVHVRRVLVDWLWAIKRLGAGNRLCDVSGGVFVAGLLRLPAVDVVVAMSNPPFTSVVWCVVSPDISEFASSTGLHGLESRSGNCRRIASEGIDA